MQALSPAATTLEALHGVIAARQQHGTAHTMFASREFREAAEATLQEVEAAVRGEQMEQLRDMGFEDQQVIV